MRSNTKQVRIQGVLANPADRKLNCDIDMCVDTGASVTVIPRKIAQKLKLKKVGKAQIQLADGQIVEHDVVYVYLYIAGEGLTLFATVNPNGDALLGFDVMELLQFQVDVARRRVLKPLRRFKVLSMLLNFRGKRASEILSKKH
jgi:predicted aspartyl protease